MHVQSSERSNCRLGIVFALPIEAHAFERLVSDTVRYQGSSLRITEGTLAGLPIAWTIGGVGGAAATRATQLLIDGHRPERLVSAGFAGGLSPELQQGQLIYPSRLLDGSEAGRPPLGVDPELAEPLWAAVSSDTRSLVTVDHIIGDAAAKQQLHDRTGADLVDMETFAVATVAAAAGLSVLACRVVSDAAGDTLPREVAQVSKPQSTMRRFGTVLGAIGRRPKAALDFWKLWEQSLTQSQRLGQGLADLAAVVAESTTES